MNDSYGFSLRQLQYAVAVAEFLSFRKAAEFCHVSQPSLSTQIAELEGQLAVVLFERNRKKVLVTGVGGILIDRMRQVLQASSDLKQASRNGIDPLQGTIQLGVIPTIGAYLLPTATSKIRQSFPQLRVAWREDKTEALLETLQQGQIDGALLALEADLGDIDYEVVAKDRFFLATSSDYDSSVYNLSGSNSRVSMKQLRDEAVLLLDEGHCFRTQALEVCSRAKARELEFRATSLPTLVQMVAQGMGVTLIPDLAVAAETRNANLVIHRFKDPEPARTIVLIWRRNSPVAAAMQKLAKVFQKAYQEVVAERTKSNKR